MEQDIYSYYKEKYPQNFGDEKNFCGFDCGWGWKKLLDSIFKIMQETDRTVGQVKEKFGGLRFYTDDPSKEPPALKDVIRRAEIESFKVCEDCGTKKSVTTEGSWLKTLCKSCRCNRLIKNKENKNTD